MSTPLAAGLRPIGPRMLGPHMFAVMQRMPLKHAYPILDAPTLEAAFSMLVQRVYGTTTRTAVRTENGTDATVLAWLLENPGEDAAPDDLTVAVLHLSAHDPAEWTLRAETRPAGRPGWRPWRWWSLWWGRFNARMGQQTLLDIAMHGATVADHTMLEYLDIPEDGSPVALWMRDHLVVPLWADRRVATGADLVAVQTMIALRGWPIPSPADDSNGSAA